jgi:hypothetical protein
LLFSDALKDGRGRLRWPTAGRTIPPVEGTARAGMMKAMSTFMNRAE